MTAERTFGEHMELLDKAVAGGDVAVLTWLRDYARYDLGPHSDDSAAEVVARLEQAGYKAEIASNIKPGTDPRQYARNAIADAMDELKEWGSTDEVRLDHELDRIRRARISLAFQRDVLNGLDGAPERKEEPKAASPPGASSKPHSP
jgi:hypothetical protein